MQHVPQSSCAILTIDLGAVARNYRLLQSHVSSNCLVAGIIKADGYGLGMKKIWAALESEDCPFYFVATLEEALALRALTQKPVAVLNGIFADAIDEAIHNNLIPVVNSLASMADWSAAAARHDIRLPVIVHFDTGMNRLGLGPDDTGLLLAEPERLAGLELRFIMSHFACADEADHPLTHQQYERFRVIATQYPGVPATLANSSAIFRAARYHGAMVRPGMALYGLNPTPELENPMTPVVQLSAPVLQVRQARREDTAGYGATHKLTKDTTLATVGIGYADGFTRALSDRGTLYFQGRACPIVGRVSMDLTIVAIDGPAPRPGEMLEVLGPDQSADQLADSAGTIGYEILTSLGQRYRRVYKN